LTIITTTIGVEAITVGVNPDTAPPAVPKAFVWKDNPSGAEVLAMWHPGRDEHIYEKRVQKY